MCHNAFSPFCTSCCGVPLLSIMYTIPLSTLISFPWTTQLFFVFSTTQLRLKHCSPIQNVIQQISSWMTANAPVLRIPARHSAYRRRISLAEPVSVLQNMEIWPCREQQRELRKRSFRALPSSSSGTLFWNVRASSVSEGQFRHGMKTRLFQQAYNLWEPCVDECIELNWIELNSQFLQEWIHTQWTQEAQNSSLCFQPWLRLWWTPYLFPTKFRPSPNLAITISDSSVVSVLTLIPPQLAPLPPPS